MQDHTKVGQTSMQINIADVLKPQKTNSRKQWGIAFNRIKAKHFDFVLCDKDTLEIRAAIELDDKTHSRKNRALRDSFLNNAAKSAGLKLVRIRAEKSYKLADLMSELNGVLTIDN